MPQLFLQFFALFFFVVTAGISDNTPTALKKNSSFQLNNVYECQDEYPKTKPLVIQTVSGQKIVIPTYLQYNKTYFSSDLYNECSIIYSKSAQEKKVSI